MSRNHPIRAFVLQFTRAVLAAVAVVFVSRWLGAGQRGELSLVLFAVNLIMIANEFVGGSSLGNLVVQYPLNRLIPFSKIWAILVCIMGALVYFYITGDTVTTVFVATLALPMSWLSIHYSLYQGFAMVNTRNILQLLLEFSRLVALFLMSWWIITHTVSDFNDEQLPFFSHNVFKVSDVLLIYGATAVGVLLISILVLWPKLIASTYGNKTPLKVLFTSGFWAQNGQLAQFLNYRLNLLLLVAFLGSKAYAGVYSNALLIADAIWIFGNSFASIAHMRMLQSENDVFKADITLRYAVIAFLGTSAACLVLFLIPNFVFVQLFGPDFSELRNTTLMLVPAILALGASTLFSHYLHAKNQFKTLLLANVSGLAVQVLLAVLLIPQWKLTGACIAADAGFVLIFIIVFALFKKQNPDAHLHGKFRIGAIWQTLTKSEL